MATAEMERWFCSELGKLGIDATEDNARYILSMEDGHDVEEYMMELLDASDPKVRLFLQELRVRCGHGPGNSVQAYTKQSPESISTGSKSKKKKNKEVPNSNRNGSATPQNPGNMGTSTEPLYQEMTYNKDDDQMSMCSTMSMSSEVGVGAKKKSKYIPLFSSEGQAKSVIQLPGRHTCECQAAKHKLINNCLRCGRVVCEQEGAGPCVFCGNLVCTPEDQEVLDRGTKRSEKLRNTLMRGGHLSKQTQESIRQGTERALKHRDKLLEYDRTSVRRTQVIDDECDYYATDANKWLSQADREKLRQREEELRKARHGSRRDRKIMFDFAGRRVVEAEDDSARKMYSREDDVVQDVHYGMASQSKREMDVPPLVNPLYSHTPKFVPVPQWGPDKKESQTTTPSGFDLRAGESQRLQDRELQEMSDLGMCLSMHQPWASLLVEGIKIHEGRSWYSSHRGRLWIASTAKTPSPVGIAELEQMYKVIHNDFSIQFPTDYPVGCLLGCVIVDDVLQQDEYREKYPDGESSSPYVFICSNPQQLLLKFPMKGQHKIYRLDQNMHQAAKKGLR